MNDLLKQIAEIEKDLDQISKKNFSKTTVKDKPADADAIAGLNRKYQKAIWLANASEDRGGGRAVLDENPQEVFSKRFSPGTEEHEFQKVCDGIYLASRLLRCYPRDLACWPKFERKFEKFIKAMDTGTANEGAEWFPTEMSARLTQLIELDLKVAALFPRLDMPRKEFDLPNMTAFVTAQKLSESTVDVESATAIAVDQPTTDKRTLSSKKLGIRMNWSMELEEETIFPLIPILEKEASKAIVRAIETAIINGDTDGTHMDKDVTASGDAQKTWDGLRKAVQSAAKIDVSANTLNAFLSVVKALGKYGAAPEDSAWITSPQGIVDLMGVEDGSGRQALTSVDLAEMFGLKTGKINLFLGRPVVVSEKVKTTLDANGVVPTTPDVFTEILLVHRPSFVLGDRRKVQVATRVWPDTDQRIIVSTWRGDYTSYFDPTVETMVAAGLKMSTT